MPRCATNRGTRGSRHVGCQRRTALDPYLAAAAREVGQRPRPVVGLGQRTLRVAGAPCRTVCDGSATPSSHLSSFAASVRTWPTWAVRRTGHRDDLCRGGGRARRALRVPDVAQVPSRRELRRALGTVGGRKARRSCRQIDEMRYCKSHPLAVEPGGEPRLQRVTRALEFVRGIRP